MINIAPLVFDIEGTVTIKEDVANTDFGQATRRQNRVATLDGSSVLQDRGYSNTDLTFDITAKKYIESEFSRLRQFVELYPEVRLACSLGSFIGTIQELSDDDASFRFLVTDND